MIDRREFLQGVVAAGLGSQVRRGVPEEAGPAVGPAAVPPQSPSFELEEATVAALQEGMASGRWTARGLAEQYLARIEALDRKGPAVNSIIELNPDALEIAAGLDRERKAGKTRGPLHGIPVLVKDNLDTGDRMMTTAGSLALAGSSAPTD